MSTASNASVESARIAVGQSAFDHVCGNCHPHGEEDIGPRLRFRQLRADHVMRQVREGSTLMSAVPAGCVSDDDLRAVLAYLREIGAVRGAE